MRGFQILNDPFLNRGTAFTEAERRQYDGLLPPRKSKRLMSRLPKCMHVPKQGITD